MFFQCPHIADGIDGNQDPEKRGGNGKQQAKRIQAKTQINAGSDGNQMSTNRFVLHYDRRHGDDDAKLCNCRCKGTGFPEVGVFSEI